MGRTLPADFYDFIRNNKIAKSLFDIYEEAKDKAMDITQTDYPVIANKLSEDLNFERKKRSKFQYDMLESIKKKHAETSLKRAIEFVNKLELIIK